MIVVDILLLQVSARRMQNSTFAGHSLSQPEAAILALQHDPLLLTVEDSSLGVEGLRHRVGECLSDQVPEVSEPSVNVIDS